MAYVSARVTSDRESLRTFVRLARGEGGDGLRSPAGLRLRALGGHRVLVRPGTSDLDTVWGTFGRRYHLPPADLGTPHTIWDLGANVGLTMAHFAFLFPHARVLGVELDGENVALARQNLAPWSDRCEVIHAAVWSTDGEVRYRGWSGGTSNYQVMDVPDGVPATGADESRCADCFKVSRCSVESTTRSLRNVVCVWADELGSRMMSTTFLVRGSTI